MNFSKRTAENDVEILTIENKYIKTEIAPGLGGKILSVYNKNLNKEFLWTNVDLELKPNNPGENYESNFKGGIDELIPNDMSEVVDSNNYPDHGELWTTPLQYTVTREKVSLFGSFKISKLSYQKNIFLADNGPIIHMEYRIKNCSHYKQFLMWKLHAALAIEEGDKLVTSAKKAKVVIPNYSRFGDINEFNWPIIDKIDASKIAPISNIIDFFYLFDNEESKMGLLSSNGEHEFMFKYDKNIFPYQCSFASYGGFRGHYTTILEPSTCMPNSVNEARRIGQCTSLEPDQEISTSLQIYAGKKINN